MRHYDRRVVSAPEWMENFSCIAGKCPETCCQQWNIDVDAAHADHYTHLGDPELQPTIDDLLRKIHVRRQGKGETRYLLRILNQEDQRCPLLNENGECRLQKKYGAYILCDTCYFHPRTFSQIDEQISLSACLSCPECARSALLHREPTIFSRFETEIDPNAEWLETSMMSDPKAGALMRNREAIVMGLCEILQTRAFPMRERVLCAQSFLNILSEIDDPEPEVIHTSVEKALNSNKTIPIEDDPVSLMSTWLSVFDSQTATPEKSVQATEELTRFLAGGKKGFIRLLADHYTEGKQIADPFFAANEYLTENFLVHCVFSDSLKQFQRCRDEAVTVKDILQHESALLYVWYLFYRVQMAQAALSHQRINEEIFMKTVIHADKVFWHYPDWFGRCADRYLQYSGHPDLRI